MLNHPSFLIIGTQKGGTSSLFDYLCRHPRVFSNKKEIHFFDFNYEKGFEWYYSFFKFKKRNFLKRSLLGGSMISGEGSPYYLYHPWVPQRVYQYDPSLKLLVLLRDPVERAISHYFHEVRKGRESLPFHDAVRMEEERLAQDHHRFFEDPHYYSYSHHRFSYKDRGKYSEQLRRWFRFFPMNRFLLLKSEDLFQNPGSTMDRVCDFLGISPLKDRNFQVRNKGQRSDVDPEDIRYLKDHFASYNEDLFQLTGIDFRN